MFRVERDYLREVAAPFANPEVGAVTAFFRAMPGGTLAADLEALVLATETVPNALVARKIEGRMNFLFGWDDGHNQISPGLDPWLRGDGELPLRRF